MRLLVVIPHYFREGSHSEFASGQNPLPKMAALNEMLAALHRHFGPQKHGALPHGMRLPDDKTPQNILDIVILVHGEDHLLNHAGFSNSSFEIARTNGDPLFLGFEALKIFQERRGRYDCYAYIEDDLIIHDKEFFNKLSWFNANFGPNALLLPLRYETSHGANPGKVAIDFNADGRIQNLFRRPGQQQTLKAVWQGSEQTFTLPINPHSGCYFMTDEQLELWMKHPSFEERDGSWNGPLESAATLTVGKVFDLYKPSEPDPWFLEIEHYGARYANFFAPDGVKYQESPLLILAKELFSSPQAAKDLATLTKSAGDRNAQEAVESRSARELRTLRSSPRKLLAALGPAIWDRATRTIRKKAKKRDL